MNSSVRLFLMSITLFLSGCSGPEYPSVDRLPVSFSELPGWEEERHGDILAPMEKTCRVYLKKSDRAPLITQSNGQGQAGDWKPFCRSLLSHLETQDLQTHEEAKAFLEDHLTPYQMSLAGNTEGTFTGYYVPVLRGSLHRHGLYQTPLYRKPAKGFKIPRSRIVRGTLKNKGLELVWVDDPVEAFFIQIQGSGRIRLDNGQTMNLGYAGQNGYPYFAIGKELIDRGILTPETVTMHSIKRWLWDHPQQAESVMSLNESYVFFKEQPNGDVIGAHTVPLTPHRSMAVDRNCISLGTPVWLDAQHPDAGMPRLQKLLMAQDIGGAIKGAVRGDYYWGVGDHAGNYAGRMNSVGNLYVLLPK